MSSNLQLSVCCQLLDYVTLKGAFGTDDEGVVEEAERWDLEAKARRSVVDEHPCRRTKDDVMIQTKKGRHKFPFENVSKSRDTSSVPRRKWKKDWRKGCRVQTKLWWRDATIYKSKDVPLRRKCVRIADRVYGVLCFVSESWCWSRAVLDRIRGWETNVMWRLLRFKRKDEEPWKGHCMRTARAARTI